MHTLYLHTAFTKNAHIPNVRFLKPGSIPFFLFSYELFNPDFLYKPPNANSQKMFEDLNIAAQFKIIYDYFAVCDEDGKELLNLAMIKPEDFINVPEKELLKERFHTDDIHVNECRKEINWFLVID
jgi:hypothetical protein